MKTDIIFPRSEQHLYAVGQLVNLLPHVGLKLPLGAKYEVEARLPERGGEWQYRVKSISEAHARMVSENDIVGAGPLIESAANEGRIAPFAARRHR